MRVALLVPDPGYPEPWQWTFEPEADALRKAGANVAPIPWTGEEDLSRFDLILPLIVWGYHLDYPRWLSLLDRAETDCWPMVNPPRLLRWNSDKAYLAELANRGVPTVPTLAVESCRTSDLEEARQRFGADWLVIKPPVSASASGTHLLGPDDVLPDASRFQRMIVQPLMSRIASSGEFSLMMFDGELSHVVVKRPKRGDFRVQPHHGGTTAPSSAPPGAIALAKEALAAAPAKAAYARVDLVEDDGGILRIMELELIEPALFLDYEPCSADLFTRAVLRSARTATA